MHFGLTFCTTVSNSYVNVLIKPYTFSWIHNTQDFGVSHDILKTYQSFPCLGGEYK